MTMSRFLFCVYLYYIYLVCNEMMTLYLYLGFVIILHNKSDIFPLVSAQALLSSAGK